MSPRSAMDADPLSGLLSLAGLILAYLRYRRRKKMELSFVTKSESLVAAIIFGAYLLVITGFIFVSSGGEVLSDDPYGFVLDKLIRFAVLYLLVTTWTDHWWRRSSEAMSLGSVRPPPDLVHCWRCKQPITVTEENRGKRVRCPACGTRQLMPEGN